MIGTRKIFLLIFIPTALVMILGLILIQSNYEKISSRQFENQLKNQWLLVSVILGASSDISRFQGISSSLGLRVTVIEKSGQVVLDTEADDGKKLDNHANREEIKNAFYDNPAMVKRLSDTTGIPTIYYAEKVGEDRVLRVAYPANYYLAMESALITQTMSGLVVLVACVAAFALYVSSNTSRALRELGEAVSSAREGGYELPSFGEASLDLALYSLSTVTRELRARDEENNLLTERLRYVLDHIQDGIILFEEKKIVYHNQKASEILNLDIPDNMEKLDRAETITLFVSLSGRDPTDEVKVGERVVSVSRNLNGPSKMVILHDITDRQRYNGYKSDLVGNVSHELKTPLTLILTTCELIIKDTQMPRTLLEKFLGVIFSNSKRLNTLLDDLVSLHRLEKIEFLETGVCDLEELSHEIVDLVDFGDKNISWNIDEGKVNIHPSHILSVLTNYIGNAVKYSTGKDIEVSVKRVNGRQVEIAVADEGPAIEPFERERVF
ncbi:MAG: PAS domain-containing sensor histidine kinase, partial [Deltaproteobacteria bacterium]|nr:PAS domain-containing sensor histidine kinase [Deltaproteobacteria bacterium]